MNSNQLRDRLLASTIIAGVVASLAAPAFAQEAQTAETDVIIVTGSRIPQANLEGASPVTVISSAEIKLQGVTRTEDLINNLPQSFAAQGGNLANGATGTATVDLRGLGSQRTMVLINGRRLQAGDPASNIQAADINAVPAALIKRVDVLTGGASSVYGADAVSGVVNFIMDTDFEGFRVDSQYSIYTHNNDARDVVKNAINARHFALPAGTVTDGGTVDATVAFGAGFDDGHGHITAYAGYRKLKEVLQGDRDFSACALTAASASSVAAGGLPFTCGGSSTTDVGRFFLDSGASYAVQGDQFVPWSSNFLFNYAPYNHFQRPDERYTFGVFADYEVSSGFKPYLEAMFMDDRTVAQIAPSGDFGNTLTVACDNPLLSAQQLSIVCAPSNLVDYDSTPGLDTVIRPDGSVANLAGLQILRRNVEGGGRQSDLQHTSYRIVTGAKGDITNAWSYDAYFQYGRVVYANTYFNDFSVTRLNRALDVIDDGDGTPVCASVVTGTDPNCVPYNIFSAGGVTPEALAYLQTPGFARGNTQETIVSGSLTGALGEYGFQSPWASDGVGINIGAEYRKEALQLDTDTAYSTGDLAGQGGATIGVAGHFDVKEVFTEVRVPIAQDKPFMEDFSVGGAYRYSKYKNPSNSFSTDTYKFEAEWAPTRDVRLRASYNRAVRAPNIVELFSATSVQLDGNADPCAGAIGTGGTVNGYTAAQCALTGVSSAQFGNIAPNSADQYNGLLGGNPDLSPEKATTKTIGLVLTPTFAPGFNATIDWFDIKIKNRIGQIGADNIITQCLDSGEFCDQIHRDQFGSLWRTIDGYVIDTNLNAGGLSTRGIDVSMGYNQDVGSAGSLGFSFTGTWLDRLITDDVGPSQFNCVGFYGLQCGIPAPEWRHKARLTWTSPWDIGVSLQWRYIGKVKQDTSSADTDLSGAVQPAHAKLPAYNYFDLSANARFADHYTFRIGVNNLFDKDPPMVGGNALTSVLGSGNTFPQVYDSMGRYVYAGITLDF